MENFEQTFLQHAEEFGDFLSDIRRRLLLCLVIFSLGFCVGFFFSATLIRMLVSLITLDGVQYIISSPFQVLSLSMDMGFFIAIVSVFPLLLVEVYEFARPALMKQERGLVMRYVIVSALLFVTGFGYGIAIMYYATWAVASLNGNLGLVNLWDISTFLSQMLLTSVLLGVLFQFPLVLSALIRAGVSTRSQIASKRRLVIALIVVVVALLPPTDGISLVVMAVPLIVLYELTLILSLVGRGAHTARVTPVLGQLAS